MNQTINYQSQVLKRKLRLEGLKSRHLDGRKMAFRCDAAFAEVRTVKETADCMQGLCFLVTILSQKGKRFFSIFSDFLYSFAPNKILIGSLHP